MRIVIADSVLPDQGVLVVFAGPDGRLSDAAAALDQRSNGLLGRALESGPAPFKHGQFIDLLLPANLGLDRLILAVVGKDLPLTDLEVEELGASLQHRLAGLKVTKAAIGSAEPLDTGHDGVAFTGLLAEGASLRSYKFDKYGKPKEDEPASGVEELTLLVGEGRRAACEAALSTAAARAAAVARARDLVSEPANVLYPETFANACKDLQSLGVQVEILDKERLEALGMRALLGVAQGSVRDPYVVVMRWDGGGGEAPLALIGKGVCFDTGGISIKPAAGMESMKWDMAGAGAVVGAMMSLAGRRARANVVGVIGLVENMPSGTAQRPGDVVRAMSGKTIEVINTDAEGRLVLADVLWYAQDRFKPAAMIDLATLTGAIVVALGHEQAGLFANDDKLAAQLQDAAKRTGELLWRMPMSKAYEKHIHSDIAEIKNVGRAREAGATAGAVFLEHFVNGVPWAHLDIAGMAWASRDLPLTGKGATAFGVRLLDRLVHDLYERSTAGDG